VSEDAELDAVLHEDAAGVYASMDPATLEVYRAAVRELARWSGSSLSAVARAAVDFAARAAERGNGAAHVGHALLGDRRVAFEAHLGCRAPAAERHARFWRRHAVGTYVTAIVVSSALALLGLERLLAGAGALRFIVCALVVVPVLSLAARITDLALWASLRSKRHLAKLAASEALLSLHRTVIVMPVIVSSPAEVEAILGTLEINHAGNPDPALTWAILTDCRDGPAQDDPSDAAIIEAARRGVAALNERHGAGVTRFHHFHRARRWNENTGAWMAWERKRGKLVEFNALVLGSDQTSFRPDLGDVSAVRGVRYVITLDADSRLTRHAARDLVATAAHPLNRPRFAEGSNRVEAGYAVLQPNVVTRARNKGVWAHVHFGFGAPNDGVFDFGRFVGKGLYDVAAFERALRNRIPENAVLSHDFLEGCFARTASLKDVRVLEDEPASVASYTRRLHRWTRGDWQLLPWLLPSVRGEDGRWHRNSLGLLPRWSIVLLLLSGLRPTALVALATVAWSSDRLGPAWIWSASLVAYLALDMVLVPCSILVHYALAGSGERGPSLAWAAARRMRGNVVVNLILLPVLAWVMTDAILRTLFRLLVSRRRLLEWTTAAHAEGSSRSGVVAALRDMRGMMLLVGAIAACVAVLQPSALAAAAPLLVLWWSAPVLSVMAVGRKQGAEK
jgi:cyclic beta-1,2-glucan synthetase